MFAKILKCTLLVAALAGSNSFASPFTFNPENLDQTESLTGIDADNSGVRDDIERHLIETLEEPEQLSAALQAAKALQSVVVLRMADLVEARRSDREIARSRACLDEQFQGQDAPVHPVVLQSMLESMTFNTKERLMAFVDFKRMVGGTISDSPFEQQCLG